MANNPQEGGEKTFFNKKKKLKKTLAPMRSLNLVWADYKWPLFFLLSLGLMGLKFPPGYLLVFVILIKTFRLNRYQFVIMLTLLAGGYGFIGTDVTYVKFEDIALLAGVTGLLIFRKPLPVKRVTWMFAAYAMVLFGIMLLSDESLGIQFRIMRPFLMFAYFIIPIMCFSGKEFDSEKFYRALLTFLVIISCMYVVDVFIFGGDVLIPDTYNWGRRSYFWALQINPGSFPRKFPTGLLILFMCLYPLCRLYKLKIWQYAVIILAVIVTKTASFYLALIIVFICLQRTGRMRLMICGASVLLICGLYSIDSEPTLDTEWESTFRVRSAVRQFESMTSIEDEEDLAVIGTGRMGQAIPKIELVYSLDKQWTGLGFLHPDLTTNPRYIVFNPFSKDPDHDYEVASAIEVFPLSTFVRGGYILVIINLAFYLLIYLMIRKWRNSMLYLSTALSCYIFGVGGISSWGDQYSLFMMGLAFAVSWLSERDTYEAAENEKRLTRDSGKSEKFITTESRNDIDDTYSAERT